MTDNKVLTIVIGGNMEEDEKQLREDTDANQPQNILYLESYEQLNKLLSPAKLDLLRFIIQLSNDGLDKSVSQIAKELNRKQEAISRDLQQLKGLKLVDMRRINRIVIPSTEYDSINILCGECLA
ncbi:MAG: hypothetical protein COV47_00145 [Candidatus Diapherotrites archaeon CG11_big_fil_rev_8_21_14_0_20_37_9]|nr:MAG: hypothetical protein COV47_00145 [Candidatus Diapherotrites archaeon CG11_big_fil_rev_8_21_14_0_20_37_9]